MKRLCLASLALLLVLSIARSSWSAPIAHGAFPAKKVCKTVKKKVHGKKKPVKVCTNVKPTPKPKPTATATPVTFTQPAKSLTVTPSLDSAAAATQTIGISGGSITVSAGGTTWTLSLPANAVVPGTSVTMTPITSLSGLPAGVTPVAAVQLAPDGLQLLKAGSLTVTPASTVAAAQQLPLTWHGAGTDTRLYPLLPGAPGITLPIVHFSGYGLASGGSTGAAALNANTLSSPQDQLEATLATQQQQCRARNTPPATCSSQQQATLLAYYNAVIAPAAADVSADDLDNVIDEFTTWEQDVIWDDLKQQFDDEINKFTDDVQPVISAQIQELQDGCSGLRGGVVDPPLPGGYNVWLLAGAEPTVGKIGLLSIAEEDLGIPSPSIDDLLKPCEPVGFKFDGLNYTQTTGGDDPINISDTYSGHVCGSSPFTTWTISSTRTVSGPASASDSGDAQVAISQGSPTQLWTSAGNDPAKASLTVASGAPATMELDEVSHLDYSLQSATTHALLYDDTSCAAS